MDCATILSQPETLLNLANTLPSADLQLIRDNIELQTAKFKGLLQHSGDAEMVYTCFLEIEALYNQETAQVVSDTVRLLHGQCSKLSS